MLKSYGKLHYDNDEGFRIKLIVNQDLVNYYQSSIPHYLRVLKPRWSAHITVVRPEFDIPPRIRYWGDYEGEEVEFIYDSYLLNGNGYFWINAWSKRLEIIRDELGLQNTSKYTLRPEGYNKTFHITVGKYDEVLKSGEAPEK